MECCPPPAGQPELAKLREKTDFLLALAGNPNVGKSTMFNRLTGMGVITANYPGMTVDINMGVTEFEERKIGIIDLPGTYALGAVSEDQLVARRGVLESKPDAVILILDAGNLARNLYMLLQFLDLGLPVVVALNMADEAEKKGLHTDLGLLAELLGVPVVPTVATRGDGLDQLIHTALEVAKHREAYPVIPFAYPDDIEARIRELTSLVKESGMAIPYDLNARALAILLLEGDVEFLAQLPENGRKQNLFGKVRELTEAIEAAHGAKAPLVIARERHGIAGFVVYEVQKRAEQVEVPLSERLWALTTSTRTGIPILLGVLASLFAILFVGGGLISNLFTRFWDGLIAGPLADAIYYVFGHNVFGSAMKWGLVDGIAAALSVAIPYVITFYLILAVLEDTGYMNSVAFLTDRVMHRFGLHGRAVIPLITAAGCNVPAIMGTRVLSTKRERTIASTLIVLVPCSARTAVIIGGVSHLLGWQWALLVYAVAFGLAAAVGLGLNHLVPGESTGLVMEMFPVRVPALRTVLKKTWQRFKDFIFVATPIMLGGSFLLGLLYETGWIYKFSAPLAPVVEWWLGLPAVAGLALIFAFVRKELALQLALVLAAVTAGGSLLSFMDKGQVFTFTLVNTIYIPCAATLAVLWRELGGKRALAISGFTVVLALVLGGAAHLIRLL